VSPLIVVAAGMLLIGLGVSGPLGVVTGAVGVVALLAGVYRIRWRNDVLGWTFWGALALLLALIGWLALAIAEASLPFLLFLLIASLQAGVAIGLATGVRACLLGAGTDAGDPRVTRLVLARTLILVTFASILISVMINGLLFAVPELTLLLIYFLTIVAYLWLGLLMFRLRDEPSLQAHSTGKA
jgi:hypothetical protein